MLVDTGRGETAFNMLKKWTVAAPHLPDPHIELARLYEEFGDKETARRELDAAIQLAPMAPQTARAWAARGRLREEAGDHQQALANYYQAYQANPFNPGVMARIASILGDHGISIEAIQQKEPGEGETHVPLVMLTHRVREGRMNDALAQIEALGTVQGSVVRIRLETLAG